MKEKPIWQQYGFESKAAFQKRYPNAAGRVQPKHTSKKQKKRSRVLSKREQIELDRYNNIGNR